MTTGDGALEDLPPVETEADDDIETALPPGYDSAKHEQMVMDAQDRDEDPDGDPGADDPGAAELPSKTDAGPIINDDADDDFSDLEDGEDDGDTELDDEDDGETDES